MAKSLEQTVTELADREQIRELPQRYCDCVWQGDVGGLVKLFVDDGSMTLVGSQPESTFEGQEQLLKMYTDALAALSPRPYIHNHVIELKGGGRASGRCYVELRDASNNMNWLGTGFYDDEYIKVGDAWKFLSRRQKGVHMEPRMAAVAADLQKRR